MGKKSRSEKPSGTAQKRNEEKRKRKGEGTYQGANNGGNAVQNGGVTPK